jgi:hypothetical protein
MAESGKKSDPISSPDKLLKTSKGDIVLTEEELKDVSGGGVRKAGEKPVEYLKIKLGEQF